MQDPVALEFVPSADHEARLSDGTPVIAQYVLEVYVQGAGTPFHTIDIGKPNLGGNGLIRYDFPNAASTWPLPGGTYEFRVKVVGPNGSGRSAPSGTFAFSAPTDGQRPSVPTSVSATPSSSTAIALAWTRATDNVGVTGYRVYRRGTRIGETASPSYVSSGLTAATTYTFTVTAVDAAGNESLPSTAVSATTLPAADTQRPTAPTNLTATPSSTSAIALAWTVATDNVGVTGYRVYRSGTRIGETASASYVNSGLTAATTYTYTVTAVDGAGNESLPSTAVSVRTAASTQPDLLTGLQGYWALNEGAGTTAGDSSGKGHSGTLRRGPTWTAGRLAGGLQLDGINDRVTVSHSTALSIGGKQLTLSAWIRFASTGTEQTAVAKVANDSNHTAPYYTYMLGVNASNKARLFVGVGGGTRSVDVVSQQTLVTGNWYHLTGVYDGAQLKLYVNGVRDGTRSESRSLTQRTSSVRIGVAGGGKWPLKGVVDEVRIYNRALSEPEIGALYQYTGAAPAVSTLTTALTEVDAVSSEPLSSTAASDTTSTPQSEVRWSQPIAIVGAPSVTTTVTGDFNGDGIDDIAAFEGGKHGGLKLFAWFESPGFVKHSLNTGFATAEFVGSAAVADLNEDGRPDIVFSMDHHSGTTQEGWVYWAENPGGDATGQWPIHLIQKFSSGTEQISDMAIDDVDGDGRVDVVVRHRGVDRVRILFQNAAPGNWKPVTLSVLAGEGLSIADLDGDDRKDLLLNGFWLAAPPNPRTGDWHGFPIDPTFYSQPDSGPNNAAKTGTGDIDGDGRLDVVISTAEGATGKLAWYRNPWTPRTAGWTAHLLEPSSKGMHQAELGDIDLDGSPDVLSGSAFGQKGVYIYLIRGASFEKMAVTTAQGLYSGKLADLDGDGDLDIIGATTYGGALYVYLNTQR